MKKFYELKMKSGRSFIASTNKRGICQFSINNHEFSIYSQGRGNRNFTFSIEKNLKKEEVESIQRDQGLEVVTLQEVIIKKKIEAEKFQSSFSRSDTSKSKRKRTFLWWEEYLYCAKCGRVQTPDGWIYGLG